jgi:hypothetical protein
VDENMLGYLLDALDPQARDEVEGELAARPELRERLEWLRRSIEPLAADAESAEPPPGLAVRALARVAEYKCRTLQAPDDVRRPWSGRPRRGLPRADLLVAACLLVVIVPLAVVGVGRLWRDHATRAACANNLRLIGAALDRYADSHDGEFPRVEDRDGPRGVAGVFVPVLRASGALTADAHLVCPGDGSRPQPVQRSLQELDELFQDNPKAFADAVRDLAGSYAYTMGYRDEAGKLFGLTRDAGDNLPILADGLSPAAAGNSLNHDGAGQNVLYVGGQVRWCAQRTVGVAGDDIYLNRKAEVGAGVCRDDTVLGPGDATPRR